MTRPGNSDSYARIYQSVRRIPRGRVATYGQIAELSGLHGQARQVGYALHRLRDASVPWHRVINAHGRISLPVHPGEGDLQRDLLEREGVRFELSGYIDLERFRWKPRTRTTPVTRPGPLRRA